MKKVFAVLLSVLLLMMAVPMGAIPVFAATSGTTGDCTWVLDGTHLTISGNGAMGDYDYTNEHPWGNNITSVTIEKGVTTIGEQAFYGCDSLTSVTIPDSITTSRVAAFAECWINEVHITDIGAWCGITFEREDANPLHNGAHLYYKGERITDLVIPDGVTTIGKDAFYYCSSLVSVTIPDSVTTIGAGAFNRCHSIKSVTISASVTTIAMGTFEECGSLTSVTIPDGVTTIEKYAFFMCNSLTTMFVPGSVTTIEPGAFSFCYSLTDIYYGGSETDCDNINANLEEPLLNAIWHYNYSAGISGVTPDGLKWILEGDTLTISGHGALNNHGDWGSSYTTLVIEEGITSIGNSNNYFSPFAGQWNLTTVYIPKSVSFIGEYSFDRCDSLTDVYYAGNREDRIKMFTIPDHMAQYQYFEPLLMCEWHYGGNASFGGTAGALTWIVEGEQLTISGNGAMDDYPCSTNGPTAPWGIDFERLVIEEGVTSVGVDAFCDNYRLQEVILPDSITTIEEGAFGACQNLGEIHFGSGITTIGDGAFSICRSMGIVNIKDLAGWCNIEIVGGGFDDGGFDSCLFGWEGTLFLNGEMVTDLVIPNGVKTIKRMAFACSKIQSVTIPSSVTDIEEYAFASCINLATVTLSKRVDTIGDAGFYGCNSLTDVYYGGNEKDRNNINSGYVNDSLFDAAWHYNAIEESEPALGDASGDGAINNKDLGLLQQYLADFEVGISVDAADINGDGKLNNRDLGLLQRYLNGDEDVLG